MEKNAALNFSKSKIYILLFISAASQIFLYSVVNIRKVYYVEMVEAFGITNVQFGLLTGAFYMASLIFYFPGGIIGDKVRIKYLVPLALFMSAIIIFIISRFPSYEISRLVFIIMGIPCTLIFWSTRFKLIRMISTDETYARYVGISFALYNIVGLIFSNIILYFLKITGTALEGLQYSLVFGAVACIILGFVSFFLIPKFENELEEKKALDLSGVLKALRLPGVWIATFVVFFIYILHTTAYVTTPYLTDVYGADLTLVSIIGSVRSFGIALIAAPVFGFVATKTKSTGKVIIGAGIIIILSILLILIFPESQSLVLIASFIILIYYFVVYGSYSISSAMLAEMKIPKEIFASGVGILSVIGYSPDVFAPIIIGNWMDTQGNMAYNYTFYLYIACCLALILICFLTIKNKEKLLAYQEKLLSTMK